VQHVYLLAGAAPSGAAPANLTVVRSLREFAEHVALAGG
jgi:hypothetical protein